MAEWNFAPRPVDFSSELNHYGIPGMKWGIRRKQPYPTGYKGNGKFVGDGEMLTRKEFRKDKRDARDIGRSASIAGSTFEAASKRYEKLKAKGKNVNKIEAARRTKERAKAISDYMDQRAVEHHRDLVKKYGAEKVSDIKRNKSGIINERVADSRAIVSSIVNTVGGTLIGNVALAMVGAPVRVWRIEVPYDRNAAGGKTAKKMYKQDYKNIKREAARQK